MSEYDFLKIFEAIIDEANVSDEESSKQDKLSVATKPFTPKSTKSEKLNQYDEDDNEEEGVDSNESSEEGEEPRPEKIDISTEFSDFIDAANALRASHSFNDKNVKGDLNTYFKGLNTGEKESLYIFFKSITQIAASDVDGDKVDAPHDHGITTSSSSSSGSESKKDEEPKEKVDQNKPEKGAPNPITVGESKQDVSDILAVLNEVNKG